ncbi:hypothetical protein [Streptomyces sp. NPDC002851]
MSCPVAVEPERAAASPAPAPVTSEAAGIWRRLEQAGLPVENVTLHSRASDPDGLLGRPGGYRSKAAFEDRRIDGGAVAAADTGSVHLGGVIEVFDDAESARLRAEQLQAAVDVPAPAEHGYLCGPVLLRLPPYLSPEAADAYGAAIGATAVPRRPAPMGVWRA